MAVEIKKLDEVIEEIETESVAFPEPVEEAPLDSFRKKVSDDSGPLSNLDTEEARNLLGKIDEGIELAERGVRQYFDTSPKRAVEFQQNHIAYLELKAKILKLIGDNACASVHSYKQNNTVIVDPDAAEALKKKLIERLYGGGSK